MEVATHSENDWKSSAYITRRLSNDILIKNYEVSLKKKKSETYAWMTYSQ